MSRTTLTFFLLILSFGILFAGCGQPQLEEGFEDLFFAYSIRLGPIRAITPRSPSFEV
jgi:hypothetical protein